MSKSLLIERLDYGEKQTIGRMFVLDGNKHSLYDCQTLELPWKNNKRSISCIPEGEYEVVKRVSPKYGEHFHVTGVDGRSYILIHKGNYYTDIRGCILVGKDLSDINSDGVIDVTHSGDTMADLLGLMPSRFKLKIVKL